METLGHVNKPRIPDLAVSSLRMVGTLLLDGVFHIRA